MRNGVLYREVVLVVPLYLLFAGVGVVALFTGATYTA